MVAFEEKYARPQNLVEPRRVPFKVFYRKYIDPGDNASFGIKYEYNNGIVEKIKKVKQHERYIIKNLMRRFHQTHAYNQGHELCEETEVWTTETQMRKPDVCFLTLAQINNAANRQEQMPSFVIEVISTHDPVNEVTSKVLEYFNAGVQVIWHVFPIQKLVVVFQSKKAIQILEGDDICSAYPALSDYEITANAIFDRHTPPQ
jgi:Uma2 family endonuclease